MFPIFYSLLFSLHVWFRSKVKLQLEIISLSHKGETIAELKEKSPPAAGAAHVKPDDQGYLWIDRTSYPEFFAGDVEPEEARAMAAVKKP